MPSSPNNSDIKHPQEFTDRAIAQRLLSGDPIPQNLMDLARLRIRYQGFPGARELQADLAKVLQRWQMTEEELFAKTREIYWQGAVRTRSDRTDREDWI